MSRGFGFVNFLSHQDALSALKHLNNNPDIFTKEKVLLNLDSLYGIKFRSRKVTYLFQKLLV